jgi:hypothetical protein
MHALHVPTLSRVQKAPAELNGSSGLYDVTAVDPTWAAPSGAP